jgi:polyisoprenyl-phosphate glycosyltransferase
MKLSVISPAFNEEEVLPFFIDRLNAVFSNMIRNNSISNFELIIVDDGSIDNTWSIIKQNNSQTPQIKGMRFSRNFGHHSAIAAGLEHATGDVIIYMDSDLQAQPEDIPKLLSKFSEGIDVVWGVASKRDDSFLIKFCSSLFYKLFNKIAGVSVPRGIVMAGFSKKVVDNINKLKEVRQFSLAQWSYVGFASASIPIEKMGRFKGSAKYSFLKRLSLALNGVIGFSTLPLKISSYIGFIMAPIGLILGMYVVLRKLLFDIPVIGYASIFAAMTFFFGIQFLILGVLGEYIGIITAEVKKRPRYIIREELH